MNTVLCLLCPDAAVSYRLSVEPVDLLPTLDVHHGKCDECRPHARQLNPTQRFYPRDVVSLGMDAEKACVHVCLARWAMWSVESPTESRTWTRAITGLKSHGDFRIVNFQDLGELEDSLINSDMPCLWIRAGFGLVNATARTGTQKPFRPTPGLTFIPTGWLA